MFGPLGAHVSIAGGTANAPARAKAIGATAMQIFSKQANRWAERVCEDLECTAFRRAVAESGVLVISAHDSYLINLASPDGMLRARSIDSFIAELRRCEALGLDFLVSHPGNYIDDRDAGIARNAEAIAMALEQVPGRTRLLLETTAGSGTVLGSRFAELARLIESLPPAMRPRVGICADTQHLWAAGYDLVGDFDAVWREFDDTIGLERLGLMHLNDSKTARGSRRDRHELIGFGWLGEATFARVMTDERLAAIPKVIETPKLDSAHVADWCMLRLLRSLADPAAASAA